MSARYGSAVRPALVRRELGVRVAEAIAVGQLRTNGVRSVSASWYASSVELMSSTSTTSGT